MPEAAKNYDQWKQTQKTLNNEKLYEMLQRHALPQELTEQKLAQDWNDRYAEECSALWKDLPAVSDLEETLGKWLRVLVDH